MRGEHGTTPDARLRGGRRNQLLPADQEKPFLAEVCELYIRALTTFRVTPKLTREILNSAEISFVEFTHLELERRIQRTTTRTTVYNLLNRVGRSQFDNYEHYKWRLMCEHEVNKRVARILRVKQSNREAALKRTFKNVF